MNSLALAADLSAATEALAASRAEVKRLRERIERLEAIARLNADTIRGMQRAASEAEAATYRRSAGR